MTAPNSQGEAMWGRRSLPTPPSPADRHDTHTHTHSLDSKMQAIVTICQAPGKWAGRNITLFSYRAYLKKAETEVRRHLKQTETGHCTVQTLPCHKFYRRTHIHTLSIDWSQICYMCVWSPAGTRCWTEDKMVGEEGVGTTAPKGSSLWLCGKTFLKTVPLITVSQTVKGNYLNKSDNIL